MGGDSRRMNIIQYLIDHNGASTHELALYCSVDPRTIRRDMTKLSVEYAIAADRGCKGKYYLAIKPKEEKDRLTHEEACLLYKYLDTATDEEARVLRRIIARFWTSRL